MTDGMNTGDLVLVMTIAGRLTAVPAVDVASVNEIERIVPVPGAPDHIIGLGAQRSRALTVIDPRKAIGLAGGDDGSREADRLDAAEADERCLIIARDECYYAIRPDRVIDVGPALSDLDPAPRGLGREWSRVAKGLVETSQGPALLLDIDVVLHGPTINTMVTAA